MSAGAPQIVVSSGVLLSPLHVAAVRIEPVPDGLDDERVLVQCFVVGDVRGHLVHDGATPAFDAIARDIVAYVGARSADTSIGAMEPYERLIAHQACRAAVEADVAAAPPELPLSPAAERFVAAYRTCWSDDLVRNLEGLGADGVADVLARLHAEIDAVGPNFAEAVALRDLLKAWVAEYRGLGARPAGS